MELREHYRRRVIRFLELHTFRGWRIKVYGIAYHGGTADPQLVQAGKVVAADHLPRPAITAGRYGVGFMGVHQGRDSNLVFIDWWRAENELCHLTFTSTPANPAELQITNPPGVFACVWDLALIGFERDAWVETVLAAPTPDIERYLQFRLNATI
jgi:hypothetical protein